MLDGHRLQRREAVQRLEALLAAVARVLDAAEGQLDAAARAVVVDEDLAALELARHAQRAAAVARPHAGHQAVGRAVGQGRGLFLAVEGEEPVGLGVRLLVGAVAVTLFTVAGGIWIRGNFHGSPGFNVVLMAIGAPIWLGWAALLTTTGLTCPRSRAGGVSCSGKRQSRSRMASSLLWWTTATGSLS